MSHHPTPEWFCPISPWAGQWRPHILVPWFPVGLLQVPSAGFALVSLVWDNFLPRQKIEEGTGPQT